MRKMETIKKYPGEQVECQQQAVHIERVNKVANRSQMNAPVLWMFCACVLTGNDAGV